MTKKRLIIESPEVLEAIKQFYRDAALIAPWNVAKLSADKVADRAELVLQQMIEKCVALGYLKVSEDARQWQVALLYRPNVKAQKGGEITQEQFTNVCVTSFQPQTLDDLTKAHQRQFGEPEVGYIPSQRLQKGRDALVRYQEAQRGVSPLAHTPLFKKLKQEVLEAGFNSLEQFFEANEVLP